MALPKPSPGLLPAENYRRFGRAFDAIDQASDQASLALQANTTTAQQVEQKADRSEIARLDAADAVRRFDPSRSLTRPGDGVSAFALVAASSAVGGPVDALPALPDSMATFGDDGWVVRLSAPGIVVMRERVPVEASRVYRARFVVRRRANSADPSNDTVRCAVAWLDQTGSYRSSTVVNDLTALNVGDGRREVVAGLARAAGDGVVVVAPAEARYARAYVQSFSSTGLTDIEVIEIGDVTDATLLPPLAADAAARIGALESLNAGPRLDVLEASAQNPNSQTFATRSDAASADIPSSVTTVLTRGRATPGDGRDGLYARFAGPMPASADGFTAADGSVWLRVALAQDVFDATLRPLVQAMIYSVSNGSGTDIQAAINKANSGSAILIKLSGSIDLNTNVLENGRIVSFDIEPGTTFTGNGSLPPYGSPSFYGVTAKNIRRIEADGSASAPVTDRTEPLAVYVKHTDVDNQAHPGLNATFVALNYKYNRGQNSNAIGVFAESTDPAGWGGFGPITFVEGIRGNGTLLPTAHGGSAYGAVVNAINQDVDDYKCLFGIESGVLLYGDSIADQPGWPHFNPGNKVSACFNAATAGQAKPDALFLANPFNLDTSHAAATGVAITNNSVWDRAFASNAVCHVGLDLSLGTYDLGAIIIPNNSDFKALKSGGGGYQSIVYLEAGSNRPIFGGGASEIVLNASTYTGGHAVIAGNLGFVADNTFDIASGGFRVRNIYLAASPTVTSDARKKVVRGALSEAEIAVAQSIPVKVFQYKDAVAEKGDAARLHIGVVAQDVIAAFEKQGLNAFAYGVVGEDSESRLVEKRSTVSKPVMEDHREEYIDYIEKDGALVLTRKTRSVQKAVVKTLPLVDEDGNPVTGTVDAVDENGLPLFDEIQIKDSNTGEVTSIKKRRKVSGQLTRDVHVYEDVEETYEEYEQTGEKILSVRYEELAMFMLAAGQSK